MTEQKVFMGMVDKQFFIRLGERIATLRKQRDITQAELSRLLGFSQQQVLSFEKGRRRIPVSLIPELAEILRVSCEELLGVAPRRAQRPGRGRPSHLEKQFEQVSQLPRAKQKRVSEMLDALLLQAQVA